MKKTNLFSLGSLLAMACLLPLTGCDDPFEGDTFVEPTNEVSEMSCVAYLENYDETHSAEAGDYTFYQFLDMLKYTNYYNALRSSKTSVTVFLPSDSAMNNFLADRGVASVRDLDLTYAKNFVQAHIVIEKMTKEEITAYSDTVPKKGADNPSLHQFTTANLLAGYLRATKGYEEVDVDDIYRSDEKLDTSHVYINDQAQVQLDFFVETSNANLMVLNSCIRPLCETMIQKLEEQGEYTIFAAAARQCGYDEVADVFADTTYTIGGGYSISYPQFTCFAPTDEAFHDAGIYSVSDLESKLASLYVTDSVSTLYNYVAYHFMGQKYTKSEFFKYGVGDSTLLYDTEVENQVLTAENDAQGQNMLNRCAYIVRSNIEARNGYIHKIDNWTPIWMPEPMKRTWDFLNSSDIINFVNSYGKRDDVNWGEVYSASIGQNMREVDLSDEDNEGASGGNFSWRTSFTYKSTDTKASIKTYRRVGYRKCKYASSRNKVNPYGNINNDDLLMLNLGYAGYIQLKTPTLIKGKYKMTLHYASESSLMSLHSAGSLVKFQLDPDAGGDPIVQNKKLFAGLPTKNYTYGSTDIELWSDIEFETSCSHQLRITMLDIQAKTLGAYHLMLDYIVFEPIE